jgi:hypothetical protein
MATLFFSYSHRDEDLRDELETHLAVLKRSGIIDTWHDRRIVAGSELGASIDLALDEADVVLLLVSSYFLASDYCYEKEMQRAMERHEAGDAVVIPVILHPCDWQSTIFSKLMATPTDGKPVSKHTNLHDAFLDITNAIKTAVSRLNKMKDIDSQSSQSKRLSTNSAIETKRIIRSSNLRVKQEFTDQDKHEFIDQTFEYIANYFEGSLQELCNRNPQLSHRFKRLDAEHFSAVVYNDGASISECKIWIGGNSYMGDILYSADIKASDNSCNDNMSVSSDDHILYFESMGMSHWGRQNQDRKLTQEGAAEYFWQSIMDKLQ